MLNVGRRTRNGAGMKAPAKPRHCVAGDTGALRTGALRTGVLLAVLAAPALAEPPDVSRDVRSAERVQREVAGMTRENAERLARLLQAYLYNQVGDKSGMEALHGIASRLARLADPNAPAAESMPRVLELLGKALAARTEAERRKVLLEASRGQSAVLKELEVLLALAQAKFANILSAKTLGAILEAQEKLKALTGRLLGETLGLAVDDLEAGVRADLRTLGDAQAKLAVDLGGSMGQLLADAKSFDGLEPAYAEAIRGVAEALRKADVPGLMRQAGEDIGANRLVKAGQDQQRIIDLLKAALAKLSMDPDAPPYDGQGTPTSIGPGPGGGPIDGAFPDAQPFVTLLDMSVRGEYSPGFGRVPLARLAGVPEPAAWRVKLPEKDRQTLANAAEQNFPPKYAELLKSYYRTLAQGGPKR